ncbi:glycosyltransferase family 4 protein [Algoriphagus aquimarinus]|uniref:glycosyltransferase family 4 protein n=1 Tax=Algoriphagus aquimarinus TaxID=237018 RepID=UPI0030D7D091
MKLLFIQDALVNAGAERSHLEILSRFSDQLDVTLVYFYPKHELKAEYEKSGIRLIFLDIAESYHFPLAISRLVKLIRKEKPDLLISSLWRADQITRIASLISGVPLIGTLVNDSYAPISWKDKKGLKYKGVYWLDRLTSGIPKHWIANAQALADSHVKTLGLEADKISVVYRGRSVPVIAPARRGGRTEGTKQSINKSKDCFVVPPRNDGGFVIARTRYEDEAISTNEQNIYQFISYGRLLERKGFQDAIQAFALVIQKYPNCNLTIYGEGPYRSNLENLITSLGLTDCVKLPGKFNSGSNNFSLKDKQIATSSLGTPRSRKLSGDDPAPIAPNLSSLNLLLSSNCFLFPSWYEGFSGALVEAMMAGIPIIASDIPMNLEAVTADINALTFPVKDVKALTQKMLYAIENPDRMAELGKAARLEAIQRFDIEKIAKEYEELLHVIASVRRGGRK